MPQHRRTATKVELLTRACERGARGGFGGRDKCAQSAGAHSQLNLNCCFIGCSDLRRCGFCQKVMKPFSHPTTLKLGWVKIHHFQGRVLNIFVFGEGPRCRRHMLDWQRSTNKDKFVIGRWEVFGQEEWNWMTCRGTLMVSHALATLVGNHVEEKVPCHGVRVVCVCVYC